MKSLKCIFLFLPLFFLSNLTFAQDWPNLDRYRDTNEKIEQIASNEVRVVFMGNSLTDRWDNADASFFSKTHNMNKKFTKVRYIDRGISGQTTPQMLVRFRADVVNLQPKVVVLLGGTNDLAGNTGPATLKMIENNIASMADIAVRNNIEVVLSSVLPATDFPWSKTAEHPSQKIQALNKWIRKYCKKKGYVYLDYYSALANNKGGMKKGYHIGDGVHPNLAGYKIMEPLVNQAIKKALEKSANEPETK